MQLKLNQKAPYGTICGKCHEYPEARYEQGGNMYNAAGNLVYVGVSPGVKEKFDPEKHLPKDDPAATGTADDTGHEVKKALSEQGKVIHELTQKVEDLHRQLEEAKAGDVNARDYTSKCAALQKALTNAKRELTKETNKAAVMETQANGPEKDLAEDEADV